MYPDSQAIWNPTATCKPYFSQHSSQSFTQMISSFLTHYSWDFFHDKSSKSTPLILLQTLLQKETKSKSKHYFYVLNLLTCKVNEDRKNIWTLLKTLYVVPKIGFCPNTMGRRKAKLIQNKNTLNNNKKIHWTTTAKGTRIFFPRQIWN